MKKKSADKRNKKCTYTITFSLLKFVLQLTFIQLQSNKIKVFISFALSSKFKLLNKQLQLRRFLFYCIRSLLLCIIIIFIIVISSSKTMKLILSLPGLSSILGE